MIVRLVELILIEILRTSALRLDEQKRECWPVLRTPRSLVHSP